VNPLSVKVLFFLLPFLSLFLPLPLAFLACFVPNCLFVLMPIDLPESHENH
jgi:hypothetical protein